MTSGIEPVQLGGQRRTLVLGQRRRMMLCERDERRPCRRGRVAPRARASSSRKRLERRASERFPPRARSVDHAAAPVRPGRTVVRHRRLRPPSGMEDRSRRRPAWKHMTSGPPGRRTRSISAIATGQSNQWKQSAQNTPSTAAVGARSRRRPVAFFQRRVGEQLPCPTSGRSSRRRVPAAPPPFTTTNVLRLRTRESPCGCSARGCCRRRLLPARQAADLGHRVDPTPSCRTGRSS